MINPPRVHQEVGDVDTQPTMPWIELWLSQARFKKYLDAAGNDRARAIELYEWNACLSAAILHDLAHLEVAIRNAYNHALEERQPSATHWTEDLYHYFPVKRGKARDGKGR